MAKLYFIYGTMKSGKSLELLKTHYNYTRQGKEVIVYSPKTNTRDGHEIKSRATNLTITPTIFSSTDVIIGYDGMCDVILIDEAQFLTKSQVINLKDITIKHDIPVLCFGLKDTYTQKLFEGSGALLIHADKLQEIKTICEVCGDRKATENVLMIDGKIITEGNPVVIGDSEYKVMCSKCRSSIIDKQ